MISSHPKWDSYKEAPISGNWFKRWLKTRFRFVDYPFLLAYRGFGNRQSLVIQGHVFRGMALSKPRRRYSVWKNFVSLIKMFLIRTVEDVEVQLALDGQKHLTNTVEDGFFEFNISGHQLTEGWHEVQLLLAQELVEGQEEVKVNVEVLIVGDFKFGCISDIDDTFLVSHVTKVWRKLYLLLTKNSQTRKPFKGVVDFYKALQAQPGTGGVGNPFFYVSSSEWNLYDFLIQFTRFHKLPKGVLQLRQLKDRFSDFFSSGYGSHDHKRVKVERIFAMYPGQSFILLGDNGQHDPYIYLAVAEKFPERVKGVYIRGVKRSHRREVHQVMEKIMAMGIPALQFKHSADAVDHARHHGFIT